MSNSRIVKLGQKAIVTFGKEHQIEMIKEECVELVHALHKLKRYPDSEERHENVISEIADVMIIMAQANLIFDVKEIKAMIEIKLDKLEKQIEIHSFNGEHNGKV